MLQITKIRKENNITQKQLAEAAGLNIRWIQKLETGEISLENITLKNMALLLKGLNTLCPANIVSEEWDAVRSAYCAVKSLLQ